MARIDNLTNFLTDVADEIKDKNGTQETISASNFDTEIGKIAFKPDKHFRFKVETTEFTTSINLKNLDVSNLTTLRSMFDNMAYLETLDLSEFDTRNVENFQYFCRGCMRLETITFGTNFTFVSATNLQGIFTNCIAFDNNTLNEILRLCTTVSSAYTEAKTLAQLGINGQGYIDTVPTLSNYQAFLDAGWTIS